MVTTVVTLIMSLVVSLVVTRMVIAHHFAFPVQVPVVPSNGWRWPHIIILLFKTQFLLSNVKKWVIMDCHLFH